MRRWRPWRGDSEVEMTTEMLSKSSVNNSPSFLRNTAHLRGARAFQILLGGESSVAMLEQMVQPGVWNWRWMPSGVLLMTDDECEIVCAPLLHDGTFGRDFALVRKQHPVPQRCHLSGGLYRIYSSLKMAAKGLLSDDEANRCEYMTPSTT